MKLIIAMALLVLVTAFPVVSQAGIIASFTADGSAFAPSAIGVGQTLSLPLYLFQTGTTELTDPGLLSAGLGVTFSPTGVVDVTSAILGTGWNSLFSLVSVNNTAGTAAIQSGLDFVDPALTETGGSILLGTLEFKGVTAGAAVLTIGDADLQLDDTLDGNGNILDGSITFGDTTSITVISSAVPEPSSFVVIGVLATFFATRRLRRRHVCQR